MSHGVSGMVTPQSRPPSTQSSPRSTLLDLAKESQRYLFIIIIIIIWWIFELFGLLIFRIPQRTSLNGNGSSIQHTEILQDTPQPSTLSKLTQNLSLIIPEDPVISPPNIDNKSPDEMQSLLRKLLYELSSDVCIVS